MSITEEILDLVAEGSVLEAEALLATAPEGPLTELCALEVALAAGSAGADQLLQRLVALMWNHPDLPRAKALYARLSELAYEAHESTLAHSHPPPPVRQG